MAGESISFKIQLKGIQEDNRELKLTSAYFSLDVRFFKTFLRRSCPSTRAFPSGAVQIKPTLTDPCSSPVQLRQNTHQSTLGNPMWLCSFHQAQKRQLSGTSILSEPMRKTADRRVKNSCFGLSSTCAKVRFLPMLQPQTRMI